MRFIILFSIILSTIMGCAANKDLKHVFRITAEVVETENGIEVNMDRPGKLDYENNNGVKKVTYDTKTGSFLKTLMEAATVKAMEKDVDN